MTDSTLQVADVYRKFRFTLRFLLGNLHDYDPALQEVGFDRLPFTDRYMLHRLGRLLADAKASYGSFQFFRTYQVLCCSPPSQQSSVSLLLGSRAYPAGSKAVCQCGCKGMLHCQLLVARA